MALAQVRRSAVSGSIMDPDSDILFDADADPDPTFHPDADADPNPDPSFKKKVQTIEKVLK